MNKLFMSAYLSTLDLNINKQRHEKLKELLNKLNITYNEGLGVYKGTQEESVLIPNVINHEIFARISKEFNQESILLVDKNNNAELHYNNGEKQLLGKLNQELIKPENIDYSLFNNIYYVIK